MSLRRFITVNRVATLLGIHHQTAKMMLESLQLPRVRVGRRHVYRTSDVFKHIDALRE